jgi:hypothetical protein
MTVPQHDDDAVHEAPMRFLEGTTPPRDPPSRSSTGMTQYVQYFDTARPHQGLSQNIPGNDGIGTLAEADGEVIAIPVLGGLHHDYRTAA